LGAEGQMVQQRQDLDAEEQEAREWSQMMVEEEVQRAVAVMRTDAEQREKRSRQTAECMEDAVDEMAGRLTGLTRAVGNVYLSSVQGGLDQHALHQMGQSWQQQAAKLAGAVGKMREEMGAVREEMREVQAGQRELARLVRGMGASVEGVGSGLGGMGSSVRATQRQLDARTAEQKRLADRVSCWEAGVGGRISPPATVRKEKGLGGRVGVAGMQGRRLAFAGADQRVQGLQKEQVEKKEKEQELEEEVERVLAELRREEEVEEKEREKRAKREREQQQQQQQQQQQPKQPRMSKREERMEEQLKEEMRKMEERMRKIEERREAEIARLEQAERDERELRELSEKELSVWDDGREVREEVQLFGCASTAC
jgi:hypothetical protein